MNKTKVIIVTFSLIIFLFLALGGLILQMISFRKALDLQGKTVTKSNIGDFVLSDNGYSGWQMGCNYTHGSDEYNQEYFDCANGLVYKRMGISNSVTYFDPKNTKVNKEHCPDGKVATFSYPDPLTGKGDGEFVNCMNW